MAKRRRYEHKSSVTVHSVRNEINVTPLVDVSLVLLIIFMVVSLKIQSGMSVPLPETVTEQKSDDKAPIVAITRGKRIYLEKEVIGSIENEADLDKLFKGLKKTWQLSDDKTINNKLTLKIDKRMRMRNVKPVIHYLHRQGVTELSFGTNPKGDK